MMLNVIPIWPGHLGHKFIAICELLKNMEKSIDKYMAKQKKMILFLWLSIEFRMHKHNYFGIDSTIDFIEYI